MAAQSAIRRPRRLYRHPCARARRFQPADPRECCDVLFPRRDRGKPATTRERHRVPGMGMGVMTTLNLDSRVVAAKQQVSSALGSDTVILELSAGRYFGVSSAGATIWKLLQTPTRVQSIRDALLEEYDVEPTR